MKILTTALMLSAMALVGTAQAERVQANSPEFNTQTQDQETRAQVVAELHAAQAAGLVRSGQDVTYPHVRAEQRFEAQQHTALDTQQQALGSVASTNHS